MCASMCIDSLQLLTPIVQLVTLCLQGCHGLQALLQETESMAMDSYTPGRKFLYSRYARFLTPGREAADFFCVFCGTQDQTDSL